MKIIDDITINKDDIVNSGNPDYELITYSWNLIDICQYKCTYCSAMNFNLHTFKKRPELENIWKSVCAKIKLSNTSYAVEIMGGEPTLHPHINDIIDRLGKQKNCVQVDLITNLAKSFLCKRWCFHLLVGPLGSTLYFSLISLAALFPVFIIFKTTAPTPRGSIFADINGLLDFFISFKDLKAV